MCLAARAPVPADSSPLSRGADKGWTRLLAAILKALDSKRLQKPDLVSGLQALITKAAETGAVFVVSKTREAIEHFLKLVDPRAEEPLTGRPAELCWGMLSTLCSQSLYYRRMERESAQALAEGAKNQGCALLIKRRLKVAAAGSASSASSPGLSLRHERTADGVPPV